MSKFNAEEWFESHFIPLEIVTQDGVVVQISSRFTIREPSTNTNYIFSFEELPLSENLMAACLRTMCRYLTFRSLSYCRYTLDTFRRFVFASVGNSNDLHSTIALVDIESYRLYHEVNGTSFKNSMASLIPFLRRWSEWGEKGITSELHKYLLDETGNVDSPEYVALRTNDPERGALTQAEMNGIVAELNDAFQSHKISLCDYALMWMFIGTGVRPIQISRMYVRDVEVLKDESLDVYLHIPLAKGVGAYDGQRWRARAPTVLAEVLRYYLEINTNLGPEMPLFPNANDGISPPSRLASIVMTIGKKLNVYSSRIDGAIPLFAYRFRYTVGTRAVELGASDYVVARILTQRNLKSIGNYRAATGGGQQQIAAALGEEFDVIARAFRGNIVSSDTDVQNVIRDFERLSGRRVGGCGTHIDCKQLAPIACLTCRHFCAFDDAPFDELKASLLNERSQETERKIQEIFDESIIAIDELMALISDKTNEAEKV